MKRLLLVLGLVAGMLLIAPTAAHACSCVTRTLAEQTARADTVLDGTVAWVTSNGLETTYGVEVAQIFKGRSATFEKIRTSATQPACGLTGITTGDRYLFLVQGEHPGQMQVDGCSGSGLYSAQLERQIIESTREPTPPQYSPPSGNGGPVDEDAIAGTSVWRVIGTGMVLALVIGGLIWIRQR